jgi:hypothetical protein
MCGSLICLVSVHFFSDDHQLGPQKVSFGSGSCMYICEVM